MEWGGWQPANCVRGRKSNRSSVQISNVSASILLDQVAKLREFFWSRMRHDATRRHPLDQSAKHVKFFSPLFPVQNPVHIRILYQIEHRFTRADFFDARRAFVAAGRKQIDNA